MMEMMPPRTAAVKTTSVSDARLYQLKKQAEVMMRNKARMPEPM